jgi:nicotinate-nucleotide adenylyltransferase
VGLLGGSFNPAHAGHRHISLYALKMLGLDAVWWLVSPQNPLKPERGMEPLKTRLASAQKTARHPKIHPTDIERFLNTRYTADTLQALKTHFPRTHFVWLMGGDNLKQIHLWKRWREIFSAVPVCVLDRPPRHDSIKGCAALGRFKNAFVDSTEAPLLALQKPPAWTILRIPLSELSSTEIRRLAGKR